MRAKALTLGLIYLLLLGSAFSAGKEAEINPWQELFTEPIEKICVIMKDKIVFRFTNLYERMVYLSVDKVEKELRKRGYKIEDIEVVIHNHVADCEFSQSDEGQYRALKRRGFEGLFLLYCHRTDKTYDIEDKKKNLK